MSDVNLNFVVENNNIGFTVEPNDITFTPTDIQLTFNTSSQLNAGGSNTQLQYNNGSLLAGIPTATYNGSNLSLGNVGNVKITGGVNGYVLQTDGTGNLDWAAAGGGGGNGTPGGSNTQIQYNDSGAFGGNAGFTFNEITGNVAVPGSLSVVGNIFGNVQTANFASFSNVANFANTANAVAGANVSGQVAFANVANNVAGANVSGQVANALIAGTVYTNAQPNITSLGTLTSVSVSGNITSGNANLGNLAIANFFSGDGSLLSNVNGSNVSNVANANYAAFAGNVVNASQPNITSLGILSSLSVSGNANLGNVRANAITLLSTNVQLGASSSAGGNSAIAIGNTANASGTNAIAIGNSASSAGVNGIAIGYGAKAINQETISIGFQAGQGADARRAVFIGYQAGNSGNASISGEIGAVGIGSFSATASSDGAVAVGYLAANGKQDYQAVAVGYSAGIRQANYAVAIGSLAGYGNNGANTQGANSIAIGYTAGYNISHANTIIINGSGQQLDSTQANSLFVKPIRNTPTANYIFYEPTTGEISYSTVPPGSANAAGLPTQIQFNTANALNASANLTFDTATNNLVVTGNIVGTLLSATGNISATGTVTGNVITGNILRGPYSNGTSNINIPSANGNIGFSANGQANLFLIRNDGIIVADTDDFYVTKANAVIHTVYIQSVAKTVSQLGAASIHEGARSYVTDATSTTFGSNAIGGGSFKMPVWCDGSNWRIG
jgi:hypothetical protein